MPLKSRGEQRVAVAADGIARIGRGRVLVAEIRGETRVAGGRELGRVRERSCRPGAARPARGRTASRRARRPMSPPAPRTRAPGAAPRRALARHPSRSAASMLASDAGHARHALGRDLPVVVGLEAHEVEALPGRLDRAADDRGRRAAARRLRTARRRARAARSSRSPRAGRRRTPAAPRPARRASSRTRSTRRGRAGGGVVGHLVVVAGDARVRGAARVERAELVAVAIGDVEDFRHVSSSEWPVR